MEPDTLNITPDATQIVKVRIDRQQHDMAYEDESEDGVTVVFRPRLVRSDDYDGNQ